MPSEEETSQGTADTGVVKKTALCPVCAGGHGIRRRHAARGRHCRGADAVKAIEYLCGAAHLREAAWHMTGAGMHRLHLALAGSPTYKVFEVLQEHFLSEVQ